MNSTCQRTRRSRLWIVLVLFWFASPDVTRAQEQLPAPDPVDSLSSRKLPVPAVTDEAEPAPGRALQESPQDPPQPAPDRFPRVAIRDIEIRGNTVLPEETLAKLARLYVDRELDGSDLEELRDGITRLYVEAGYRTSGAILPDQDFGGGLLVVRVVEGRLSEVEVSGNRGFHSDYLRRRVIGDEAEVLNINDLERRLQRLRRDPEISTLHAVLSPGIRLGEARLELRVIERRRYDASLEINNHQSSATGATNGRVGLFYSNLAGRGDKFSARGGISKGLRNIYLRYQVPVTRNDAHLDLYFHRASSEIVESSTQGIDIESGYLAGGVSLARPVYRSPKATLELGIQGEWRQSKSYIDGYRFSFSDAADNGRVVVSALRLFQDWLYQSRQQVVALRSTWSFGQDIFGATSGAIEKARFTTWIGQMQWMGRLDPTGLELQLRGDVQLAFDPLAPFERFSIGGRHSVRGYSQNELVRDSGYSASLEARYPILRSPDGRAILQIVNFIDVGHGWNRGRGGDLPSPTLAGVGGGFISRPHPWLDAEIFYAAALSHAGGGHRSGLGSSSLNVRFSFRSF